MRSLRESSRNGPHNAAGQPSRVRTSSSLRQTANRNVARRILAASTVAGLACVGAAGLKFGLPIAAAGRLGNDLAVKIGLGVNQIAVTGSRNTLSDDIFACLQLEHPGSLLTYDTTGARTCIEALPWVATAGVSRSLPDGIEVAVRERLPLAVWQHRQLMFLIDADGRTLEPTSRADHQDLPLVVGEQADAAARDLLDMLKSHGAISSRLIAAVRVGGRRWDLTLKGAPVLLLPEVDPAKAVAWVERMDKDERILERRVAAIDLRVEGRVAFRLAPDATVALKKPGTRQPGAPNGGV